MNEPELALPGDADEPAAAAVVGVGEALDEDGVVADGDALGVRKLQRHLDTL